MTRSWLQKGYGPATETRDVNYIRSAEAGRISPPLAGGVRGGGVRTGMNSGRRLLQRETPSPSPSREGRGNAPARHGLIALCLMSSLFAATAATTAAPLYAPRFAPGEPAGWKVMWNPDGKLEVAVDAAPPGGQTGTLRIVARQNARGTVGTTIAAPPGAARDWKISLSGAADGFSGKASFNLKCLDNTGKQIAWISVFGLPTGAEPRTITGLASIPPEAARVELLVLLEGATGTLRIGDVQISEFTLTPDDEAKVRPRHPTRWGATGLDRAYGMPRFEPRMRDTALKLLVCAGVKNYRLGLGWATVEPERGKMDFSDFTGQLDEFAYYGVEVPICFLNGTPPWASGKTGEKDQTEERKKQQPSKIASAYWPPRDWSDWERFVAGAVAAAKGRVQAWEILNEPDLWSEGFNGTYEDYKEYLRRAYLTAKRVDPNCRVFVGSMVFGEWLPRLLNDGWAQYFDGVTTHPYAGSGAATAARNRATQLLLIAAGAPRETWVTEVGFQSGGWKEGPGVLNSEDAKAREGRIALQELAKQCELVTWYSGNERGNMYGLNRVEPNLTLRPMPIFYEYGDLTGRLKKSENQNGQAGGPVQVEVLPTSATLSKGVLSSVVLKATNRTARSLSVKLWPVGFSTALEPQNDGPRSQDWAGVLQPNESRMIEMKVKPTAEAKGAYPLGLAVICDEGNSLKLVDVMVAE